MDLVVGERMTKARIIEKVTATQFAQWSFERDLKEGLFDDEDKISSWKQLPKKEKQIYLAEAEEYLNKPLSEWPIDILERL